MVPSIDSEDFWNQRESLVLLNPRQPEEERAFIKEALSLLDPSVGQNCIWIQSSGTQWARQGWIKMVCLDKTSFLQTAQWVNDFYEITSQDCWLNPLPLFHVGGVAVGARCFLAQASMRVLSPWSASQCLWDLEKYSVTCLSLVPTQLYDLLKEGRKAPKNLRMVLVGGGALSNDLYMESRAMGWPIYPCYGMTETSALLAGAPLDEGGQRFPWMKKLEPVGLFEKEGVFYLESSCLFKGYLFIRGQEVDWQERKGPFLIEDRLEYAPPYLRVLGRSGDLVKILGETVNLGDLEYRLSQFIKSPFAVAIVARKESRRGFVLHAYVEGEPQPLDIEGFNKKVMPYERISEIFFRNSFPRTSLGKVIKSKL